MATIPTMGRPFIYVVHAPTGTVLAGTGQGRHAVEQALDYALRRQALRGYLALRQGFPPNVYEPLRVMARGGRPLGPGDAIAKPTRGKWRNPQGQYKTRQQGQRAVEIASVLPAAAFTARAALAARYPGTWRRYLLSLG